MSWPAGGPEWGRGRGRVYGGVTDRHSAAAAVCREMPGETWRYWGLELDKRRVLFLIMKGIIEVDMPFLAFFYMTPSLREKIVTNKWNYCFTR